MFIAAFHYSSPLYEVYYAILFTWFSLLQFHFKQNQRKEERKNKMDSNDDECRLIPKSGRKTRAVADKEDGVQVSYVNVLNIS